ncbi:uncharacterized protein HRG_11396 [Hirsutella rhossiliensis]|uniref:Azaphilone pigments biosynthesis cluster protein L N-terminal domain-containing protein n=1 Tax=Hirsutella rhossiliensis TaxID=111463 RepID=A0A9P8MNF8_9HYPO|nr:uncharacterized protein HRG_11396 [Hirsutella rhossiliensis]KAH0957614.1 hypothetical protein HRG_11396 [Hirsutella rhossiliensis]
MAEPVGLASGLLALATFAFQSSITLYSTVQSFRDHPKRVRDLIDELEALSGVLGPLTETVSAVHTVDLSALDRPLLRCGHACAEFNQELMKCVSQSGDSDDLSGWAKLKYMGDDIDGFRRLLSGYKSTITIALTDANLRVCSATAETIRSYKDLVETAHSDLRAHLESIDEKIGVFLADAISETGSGAPELQTMQEERLSTQRCLEICDQLSKHIDEFQLATKRSGSSSENEETATFPEKVVNEGLNGCRKTLTTQS